MLAPRDQEVARDPDLRPNISTFISSIMSGNGRMQMWTMPTEF